ncbi:GNAT family N-acetyltransferase [Methylomagnum sp.]
MEAYRVGRGEAHENLAIRRYEDILSLPPECAALFLQGERESFDLSRDWFQLLVSSALPENARPLFYVMVGEGGIRAILPLLIQPSTKQFQVVGLVTFYSSLYRPLLAAGVTPEELAVALRYLIRDTGASALRLDAMDIGHPSLAVLEPALRLCGLATFRFFCFGNHYLPTGHRPFAEYFRERPSQIRKLAQRRERKFLANGRGRFEIVSQGSGTPLDEIIRAWERIYSSSWKHPEPYPSFIPNLMRLCATRGWLRFGLAYYDGQPVAAQIWIICHGRAAIYKLAYDEKFSALSAGTLLTIHLMRHVMDVDNVAEVDYLVGDDSYKGDWMSHRRERWGVVAYDPLSLSGSKGILIQFLGRLRDGIRKCLMAHRHT